MATNAFMRAIEVAASVETVITPRAAVRAFSLTAPAVFAEQQCSSGLPELCQKWLCLSAM